MTSSTRGHAPSPTELNALLRLLDDDTPEVRQQVSKRLESFGGDISEHLAAYPLSLSPGDKQLLADILSIPRRAAIEQEWLVPSGGAAALREDWDRFESLLRTLSDYLHDGMTCRQPLSDALDLLAEEAESRQVRDAKQLSRFLFERGQLRGNQESYEDPRNSDLAWCIAEGKSNPIGLCVIYCLVARRMQFGVEPINFPGHFLCRIHENGHPMIVDCFHQGKLHQQSSMMENPDLSRGARHALRHMADPGSVLVRILNNLNAAFLKSGRKEDARLVRKLNETLTEARLP